MQRQDITEETRSAVEMNEVSTREGSPSPDTRDAPINEASSAPSSRSQEIQSELKPKESQVEASAPEQTLSGVALPEPGADQTKNTIVIKNLSFKFKQTDLDALLAEHHANPKNVRLMRDNQGRFTGIAFIRCPSKEEASRLILSMNNLEIGGRNIQVDFKQKKRKSGKLNTSTDLGMTSSDSEMSQPTSLRSSGEFNREALIDVDQKDPQQLKEPRQRRLSAEYATPIITQEHLQLPPMQTYGAPVMMYSHFADPHAPMGFNPHRRYSLSNSAPVQPPQTSYFHYPHFGMAQQNSMKKKMDIRRSTQCVNTNTTTEERPVAPANFERRRSIATMDDPAIRNASRPNSVIRPPSSVVNGAGVKSAIAPVRQPVGPDGHTNGFSMEYRNSRTVVH